MTCPAASSSCKAAGTCQASDGQCSAETDIQDWTQCDDRDAATDNDVCTAGVCTGVYKCTQPAAAVLGYDLSSVVETSLSSTTFNVSVIACRDGYAGTVVISACTTSGQYEVAGCNRVLQMTFAKDIAELASDMAMTAFKDDFKLNIASALTGVTADRVVVSSVIGASVLVEFFIEAAAGAATSADAVAELTAMDTTTLQSSFPGFVGLVEAPIQTTAVASVAVPTPAPDAKDDEGGSSGAVFVFVLVLCLCGGSVAFNAKSKGGEDGGGGSQPAATEKSETIFNPMDPSNPGGSAGGKTLWKAVVDPNSGKTYYVNRDTRETSWKKPPDADRPWGDDTTGGGGGGGNRQLPAGWVEHFDEKRQKPYYHNTKTNETSWKFPPLPEESIEV